MGDWPAVVLLADDHCVRRAVPQVALHDSALWAAAGRCEQEAALGDSALPAVVDSAPRAADGSAALADLALDDCSALAQRAEVDSVLAGYSAVLTVDDHSEPGAAPDGSAQMAHSVACSVADEPEVADSLPVARSPRADCRGDLPADSMADCPAGFQVEPCSELCLVLPVFLEALASPTVAPLVCSLDANAAFLVARLAAPDAPRVLAVWLQKAPAVEAERPSRPLDD